MSGSQFMILSRQNWHGRPLLHVNKSGTRNLRLKSLFLVSPQGNTVLLHAKDYASGSRNLMWVLRSTMEGSFEPTFPTLTRILPPRDTDFALTMQWIPRVAVAEIVG